MDPALTGIIGGGLVLLGVCSAIGLIVWGRSTRQDEIDTFRGLLDIANATIKQERQRHLARANGAQGDFRKAADLSAAAAAGDLDGVLQYFPGNATGASTGERGAEANAGGDSQDDTV